MVMSCAFHTSQFVSASQPLFEICTRNTARNGILSFCDMERRKAKINSWKEDEDEIIRKIPIAMIEKYDSIGLTSKVLWL